VDSSGNVANSRERRQRDDITQLLQLDGSLSKETATSRKHQLLRICALTVVVVLAMTIGFTANDQASKSGFPVRPLPTGVETIMPAGPVQTAWGFPPAQDVAVGPAGSIGIKDGAFTVGGQETFLLLFSYFGALRDAVFHPDWLINIFNAAAAAPYSFDGVRVFPTWWNDPPASGACGYPGAWDPTSIFVVNPDGTAALNLGPLPPGAQPIPPEAQIPGGYHPSVAGRLQFLLDQAYEKGLVVDLSFAPETVERMWNPDENLETVRLPRFRSALFSLASALKTLSYPGRGSIPPQTGYYHAFLDVANESNCCDNLRCKPPLHRDNQARIAYLLNQGVRAGDPARIATASTAGGEAQENWTQYTQGQTANLVAYHEPRIPYAGYEWWFMTYYRIAGYPGLYVGYRDLTTLPIYLDEEEKHFYCRIGSHPWDPLDCQESSCDQNAYLPSPGCEDNYSGQEFLTSALGAKQAGAAAWTWHTRKLFRFASDYPPPGLSYVEQYVVSNLRQYVGQ
jgi:hypothetical protein